MVNYLFFRAGRPDKGTLPYLDSRWSETWCGSYSPIEQYEIILIGNSLTPQNKEAERIVSIQEGKGQNKEGKTMLKLKTFIEIKEREILTVFNNVKK